MITLQAPKDETDPESFDRACQSASEYFEDIDRLFSTYRSDSEVSLLRLGKRDIDSVDSKVQHVWNTCQNLRELTNGGFDPWSAWGGFDPSGFVKGWAAKEAINFFTEVGIQRIQVNAGGDLVMRGGYSASTPWKVGIQHPEERDEVTEIVELFDGAIASSGTYERGSHIVDPRVGVPAVGSRAATVVGPDGGIADALATALIVDGRDSISWLNKPDFADYAVWVADRHDGTAWTFSNSEETLALLHGKNSRESVRVC